MNYRTFITCVLILLVAILAIPSAFADGGGILPTDPGQQVNVHPSSPVPGDDNLQAAAPSIPVPGDDDPSEPITTRLATPLYPDAVRDLAYSVQIFKQSVYLVKPEETKGYPMTLTVSADHLDNRLLYLEQPMPGEQLTVKVFVAGRAGIMIDKFVVDRPGTVQVTALAFSKTNPKLIWVDSAQFNFTGETGIAHSLFSGNADPYALVHRELARAIINWRAVDYSGLPRKSDVKGAMGQAFDLYGTKVSDDFVSYLSMVVQLVSNGKFEVYRPTMDEYHAMGGDQSRTPYVDYLARRNRQDKTVKPFAIYPDGTIAGRYMTTNPD